MARRILELVIVVAMAGCAAQPGASPSIVPPSEVPPSAIQPSTPSSDASQPATIGEGDLVMADVARAETSPDDARAAADGINDFGLELLRRLVIEGDNAVISPASVAVALGMARAGALGTTADEMDAVLRDVARPENAAWLNALDLALASRNQTFVDDAGDEREVILRVANAMFAQRGMAIKDAYLAALAETYGAGVRLVDYIGAPDASRQEVNGWVDERTEGRIPDLLGADDVNELTRWILVNAIYLRAPWAVPFPEEATTEQPFTRVDGSRVQVPMMATAQQIPYASGTGWRAVEVPYFGDTLSMLLILPDDLAAFVADANAATLNQIVGALSMVRVELTMPRFGIETKANLKDVLKAMGMPTAFTDRADFSGITSDVQIRIAKVIHQANIDVDEAGTEAAAATAVIGEVTSGGPPPSTVQLRLDHPFLFALRDIETGAVIFLGQVGDPSRD